MEDPDVKEKRKRQDVADKQKKKKTHDQRVVKACLRRSTLGDKNFKDKVTAFLLGTVERLSRRLVFASRNLSWLLKELFDGQEDLQNVQLPDIFDATFIRQMMLGCEDCDKPLSIIKDFYERHPESFVIEKRVLRDSNVYSHAAKKYRTNLKTSLKVNFPPRLKKYLKTLSFLSTEERVFALYKIMGWKQLPKNIKDLKIEERLHVLNIVEEQRNLLGLTEGQEITEAWLDKEANLFNVLKYFVFLNRLGQGFYKPFDIVPICQVRHCFATLDTAPFLGMLKELGEIKSIAGVYASKLWRSVFNIKETKEKSFTGTIDTDGKSICFHYESLKKVKENEEDTKVNTLKMFQDPSVRKFACDPGRSNIYSIVEDLGKGEYKKHRFTRGRYYTESGVLKAGKNTERWSKDIRVNLDKMSLVSSKGVELSQHQKYMETFLENFEPLWKEYTKKRWADQRLRLYGGKKRSLENFWNEVLGKENERRQPMVMAFGAAKFAPTGKGEISVPTSQAFTACKNQKGLKVVLVDEFRSSKIDYKSDQLLKLVKVQGDERPLRGLLWCDSTSQETKQGTFVNRDVNAALNILRCATQPQRPKILNRSLAKASLPKQQIAKVLRRCVAL